MSRHSQQMIYILYGWMLIDHNSLIQLLIQLVILPGAITGLYPNPEVPVHQSPFDYQHIITNNTMKEDQVA